MPDSIATMRERIAIAIARTLNRCPCCARLNKRGAIVRRL
jgi:AhpD family alkylhydroperoxidase